MKPIVAYIRVSTQKQGKSGLGIEAQQAMIARFAADEGLTIAKTFVEIETGKGADALEQRPQLAAAITAAKGGTLIVAKLDRLTRNVAFGSALVERKDIAFRLADNPHANNFMIHILLAVAEKEREMISERTKQALAAAKARGVKLGNPNAGQDKANAANLQADQLRGVIIELHGKSSREVARELNTRGITTATGGQWQSMTALRLMKRIAA